MEIVRVPIIVLSSVDCKVSPLVGKLSKLVTVVDIPTIVRLLVSWIPNLIFLEPRLLIIHIHRTCYHISTMLHLEASFVFKVILVVYEVQLTGDLLAHSLHGLLNFDIQILLIICFICIPLRLLQLIYLLFLVSWILIHKRLRTQSILIRLVVINVLIEVTDAWGFVTEHDGSIQDVTTAVKMSLVHLNLSLLEWQQSINAQLAINRVVLTFDWWVSLNAFLAHHFHVKLRLKSWKGLNEIGREELLGFIVANDGVRLVFLERWV